VDGRTCGRGGRCGAAFPALPASPAGDRVACQHHRVDLGLALAATPGWSRSPTGCRPTLSLAGHLIKARYSTLQACVLARTSRVAAPDVLRDADDIGGMPVVVADLHSALPGGAGGDLCGRTVRGTNRPPVAGQLEMAAPRVGT